MLFIHETFLVHKMNTFKNCKEVKHITIMIIDDFLSYVIFDQQLKITFRKSSGPLSKNPLPRFYSLLPPLQIQKVQVPLFANIENFSGSPPAERGKGHCGSCTPLFEVAKTELLGGFILCSPRVHYVKSVRIRSFSGPYFPAFGLKTEIYELNLHIQSKCGKIRTRKTPNTDTFYAVVVHMFSYARNLNLNYLSDLSNE